MKKKIEQILKKALGKTEFDILIPEQEAFGHYSINAALRLAQIGKKPAHQKVWYSGKNPLEIAGQIVAKIEKTAPRGFFEKIEIANPGFINFWLSAETLRGELKEIMKSGAGYGKSDVLKNKKIMVEFTDPNPFKEFHVGHLYSNIIGETLSKLLEASGAKVKRANYQGDVGLHVAKAVWGMQEKMASGKISSAKLEKKNLDFRIRFMSKSYVAGARAYEENAEAKLEMTELNKKIFSLDKSVRDLYQKGRRWSLQYFEEIYKRLGTKFDFYYFESEIAARGLELVKEGLKKKIFEESEGAIVFPGEKYGLHLRVFINSHGLPTYEAKELGLVFKKYKDFQFNTSISVTGNDIKDYFKVLIMAIKQINSRLGEKMKHIPHGIVRLPEGKMASRTGNVILAEDLLDDMKEKILKIIKAQKKDKKIGAAASSEVAETIAVGAVKYSLLKSNIGSDIIFDFEKSLNLHGDSGPYIQYTYARLKSILRKAGKIAKPKDFLLLNDEQELRIIRKLAEFPEIIKSAAENYAPNHLATYLYELAALANRYYESTPILSSRGGSAVGGKDKNRDHRNAHLLFIATVADVLKNGLGILGIETPKKI